MRSHSDRFARAVATSHTIASRADILFGGVPLITGLPIVGGEVTFDRDAAVLARCIVEIACTVDDVPYLLPTAEDGGPLSPFGYEVQVWRGVTFGDDDEELVSLGIFPIQHTSIDGVTLLATIEGLDRAQLVRDAEFEVDVAVTAGINAGTVIRNLIEDVGLGTGGVVGLEFSFASTSLTAPVLSWAAGSDRWDAAQQIARAVGMWLYFDGDGVCTMRPEPGGDSATPVVTVSDGDGGTLTALSIELDRENAYNKVIVTGSNSSLGVGYRGVATDDDPGSPTVYGGPFGRKPFFYSTPVLTSDAEAGVAAQTRLGSLAGVERGVSFSMVPNPALEPGDVVEIICTTLSMDELHILDGFTIGLSADTEMGVG